MKSNLLHIGWTNGWWKWFQYIAEKFNIRPHLRPASLVSWTAKVFFFFHFCVHLLLLLKLSHNFLRFMEKKSVVSIGKRTCSSPEGWIANVFRVMFPTVVLRHCLMLSQCYSSSHFPSLSLLHSRLAWRVHFAEKMCVYFANALV